MDIEIKEKETKKVSKKIIGVQVTDEIYDALQKKSEEEWLTISDIVRRLIRDYLKERK